ncbi:acyl-CoA thioesterase domain-containing protein [Mycobacterium spongiae]|uniref:acyl-CoA thioesterase domain-containing protein n=1 Tax=Mycobacterium spongiae TaxID=886343 RepID=UPI001BAB3493|nr:acyl-CoA thioesterase domain-containing protein [Mycobacterium spongiae]
MTVPAATVDTLLGCRPDDDGLRFEFGRHLHGAFGGAFGGGVAAAAIRAARTVAPDRLPASLDVRFLRGLGAGSAHARPTVLRAGRSLTTVSVDIADAAGRPAARATVGLTDAAALYTLDRPTATDMPPLVGYDAGTDWRAPGDVEIPILATLHPRTVGSGPSWIATGLALPWNGAEASAEAICLAADMCVGPPVAAACADRWIPHPNPDLSLRFVGEVTGCELAAVGRLERICGGLAVVGIAVWAADEIVGVGVSSSMLQARSAHLPTGSTETDPNRRTGDR